MINFPFEVGILGWVSTAIFGVAVVMVVVGVVRVLFRKK